MSHRRSIAHPIVPPSIPRTTGGYEPAVAVEGPERWLFVSGQVPETVAGEVPSDAAQQCDLVWTHVLACVAEAGMDVTDVVKVTTYLSTRDIAELSASVRRKHLGAHAPALTVVICEIWDPRWLLEVEVIACATGSPSPR